MVKVFLFSYTFADEGTNTWIWSSAASNIEFLFSHHSCGKIYMQKKCKAHSLILRERDARLSCSSRTYEWSSLVCKYRWFCKCTEQTKISFSRQRLVIIRLGRLDSKELSPATSSSWCEMKLSNMHSNNWIIRGNCRQSSCLLLLHYPPYERKITGNNMEYYTKATASPP